MATKADLTFVHLSDIHFRQGRVGTPHDPDHELRDQLLLDLRSLSSVFAPISGIIITGDLAWGGHEEEYAYADSWIRALAGHLRCELQDVMVTPGNHDVYRPELKKQGNRIAELQKRIRRGSDPDVCVERLTAALSGDDGDRLLRPLRAYNAFAAKFQCAVSRDRPYWERTFHLGDGSPLVIRGLTSTWLSGPGDSEKVAKLLYGSAQYTFPLVPVAHRIVAGHHPPQNAIDGEEASRCFDFHTRLQLFGHKHAMWITKLGTSAKIVAGALHPDRREKPWVPRYNILQMSAEVLSSGKTLNIDIYPRRWSDEFRTFMADFAPNASEARHIAFPY